MAMDVWETIKKDHRTVEDLFKKMKETSARAVKSREQLFEKIRTEFEVHAQAEEKAVYPALKKLEGTKDRVGEAVSEHNEARKLIRAMARMDKASEEWLEKCEELEQNIQHHVEEEENEIIPAAQEEMDEEKADELLEKFKSVKQQAMKAAE